MMPVQSGALMSIASSAYSVQRQDNTADKGVKTAVQVNNTNHVEQTAADKKGKIEAKQNNNGYNQKQNNNKNSHSQKHEREPIDFYV